MIKIILGSIVSIVIVVGGALFWFSHPSTESYLFKVGSCLRSYRVGQRRSIDPSKNPQKLYPVPCPVKG